MSEPTPQPAPEPTPEPTQAPEGDLKRGPVTGGNEPSSHETCGQFPADEVAGAPTVTPQQAKT